MPITAEEHDLAWQHLTSSQRQLHGAVDGLSAKQWHFHPDGVWSPTLILEHIYVVEAGALRRIMQSPPSEKAKPHRDQRVLHWVLDRSFKMDAPEAIVPQGRTTDPAELLRKFDAARERSLAWLDDATADHRAHAMPHPFLKEMDGYQWLLFVAAHCERHIAQIDELKARPDFPDITIPAGSSVPR